MNGKNNFNKINIDDVRFVEEQLFDAQQRLFMANSVREVKFLTMKINYLKQKLKESNGKRI